MKDIIIIGAGPAGSTCAYHAARAGLDVALIDKKEFPRFKSCGGALTPRALDNLGPKGKKAYNCTVDGLKVYSPKLRMAEYSEKNTIMMVIRTNWDHQLYLDAVDAGANSITDMVTNIEKKSDSAVVKLKGGDEIEGRYIVIADGAGRRSYKLKFGFDQPYDHMARTVCAEIKYKDKWIREQLGEGRKPNLFFGVVPRGYGWLFPKKGYINIGIGFGNENKPAETQFQIFDRFVVELKKMGMLPKRLDTSCRVAHPIPFKKPFEPTGRNNMLLVGDAGGFVSPVTGEGLYYATTTGRLAAETIKEHMLGESVDLVADYKDKWMNDFGEDMIKYGLWLANFIYKSNFRMETFVKLMIADEETLSKAALMVYGKISYKDARNAVLKRAPVSLLKSLRV